MRRTITIGVGLLVPVLLTACAGGAPREESTASGLSITRVGAVGLAPQPGPEQYQEIADLGYRTVLTLRGPEELEWDESMAISGAGMRSARVPVDPDFVEVGLLARLRSIIEQSPKPLLMTCRSGNRTALVWGMLEAGKRPDDEIVRIARSAGLKEKFVPTLEAHLARQAAGQGRLR